MVPQSRMPVVCSSTMHPFPYKQPVGVTTSVHSLASTAKSTTMSSCGSILARTMKTIRGNERVATPPRVGMSYYAAVSSSSECRWKRRPTVAQRGHVSASQGDWVATVERRRQAQPGSRVPTLLEAGSLGAGRQSVTDWSRLLAPSSAADCQRGHRRRRRQPDKKVDTAFQRSSVFVRNPVGGVGGWDVAPRIISKTPKLHEM